MLRGGLDGDPARARESTGSLPALPQRSRDGVFRAFLRPGIWTLFASIGLVVVTGVLTFRAMRSRGTPSGPEPEIFRALGARPLDAGSAAPATGSGAPAATLPFPRPESLGDQARASLAVLEDVERGHVDGAWSVARKRFDPCPGEDIERVAWIDVWSRILKMTGTRAGAGEPVRVEQWFDRDGRLRAVRASRGGATGFNVQALLDDRGTVVHRDAAGAAPSLEALGLTMRDPSRAFFERPRCDPEKK